MKAGQDKLPQNIKSVQAEVKEEIKGISAAQDTLKEVEQERLFTVESRMDSFEEKITLVEAKLLQMEENFEKNIREMGIGEKGPENTVKR